MRLHLSCSADSRYVHHSAAMISSALEHRGENELTVHFLHDSSLDSRTLGLLAGMMERRGGELNPIRIPPDWVEGLSSWDYITSTMWFRIFLPELLADVDRVLYLDVDTIVLDALDELFATDLRDSHLAAVSNVFQLDHLGRLARLGIDDPRDYFNSGVLLMNLDLMRRDGSTQALKEFAIANGDDLLWPDQDTLNLVLGETRRPLHPRWNVMTSLLLWPWSVYAFGVGAVEEARRHPGIRHFEGPSVNKPWHASCESPFRDRYFEHRRRTPWPEVEIEGRTTANVARRAARLGAWRLRGRRGLRP